jgi:hypothetical protein
VNNAEVLAAVEMLRSDFALAEVRRLRRAIDCWHTNNRTMVESAQFKHDVIYHYGKQETVDTTGRIVTAKCMISDRVYIYGDLCPAHLVKHCKPELMTFYGLEPTDIDNPRNGILLLKAIEVAFDHKDVCFLWNPFNLGLYLRVLSPTLASERIHPTSSSELRTFADINNAVLMHNVNKFPYRRILSMHAKLSFSRALRFGWLTDADELTTYFNLSEPDLEEPECLRGLTWKEVKYAEIETTI